MVAGDSDSIYEPALLLSVGPEELPVVRLAVHLFISDQAHHPAIRRLARRVLTALEDEPDERGILTTRLSPPETKITHSAVKLLLDDLQREQAAERKLLRAVLRKLPDEDAVRAITLS
jgi:hypothetical protein